MSRFLVRVVKFLVRVSKFLVRVSKNLGTACYLVLLFKQEMELFGHSRIIALSL